MLKMHSLFILSVLLIFTQANSQSEGANAVNQFTQKLQPQLCEEGKNCAISAYSIFNALGLTYAGSQGNTQSQIQDVLYLGGLDMQKVNQIFLDLINSVSGASNQVQLLQANRLYGANEVPFFSTYLETLQNFYKADAQNLDFVNDPEGSAAQINGWVAEVTNYLIQNLIPASSISADTISILVNALYFKGTWITSFDPKDTSTRQFTTTFGSTVDVPMMAHYEEKYMVGDLESVGASFIKMPYKGGDLGMHILVPKSLSGNPSAQNIFSIFQSVNLNDLLVGGFLRTVNLFLPKFTVDYGVQFSGALKQLGMVDAFDPSNANFGGMVDLSQLQGKNVFVKEGYHKAKVIVDETGTEAAAATAFVVEASSLNIIETIDFVVDVPFAFFIVKYPERVILFSGIIDNPISG